MEKNIEEEMKIISEYEQKLKTEIKKMFAFVGDGLKLTDINNGLNHNPKAYLSSSNFVHFDVKVNSTHIFVDELSYYPIVKATLQYVHTDSSRNLILSFCARLDTIKRII